MKREAHMVEVGQKPIVRREAEAEGVLRLHADTVAAIRDGTLDKGDALEVARTAGILAAKNTPNLLPLCHPIPLESVGVAFLLSRDRVRCRVHVTAHWKTGVEMEALVACSTALLTVWDMAKPLEKNSKGQYPTAKIEGLRVVRKVKG